LLDFFGSLDWNYNLKGIKGLKEKLFFSLILIYD